MTHPFAAYRWDQQAIGDTVLRYLAPVMCECVAARIDTRSDETTEIDSARRVRAGNARPNTVWTVLS